MQWTSKLRNCIKKASFLQTKATKVRNREKTKHFLQNLQKPLAFSVKVCYNKAREKTDVTCVGFPMIILMLLEITHEIRSDEP